MKKDLTDITLIVDRSGSMRSCASEAQNGINVFIKEQKEKVGNAIFSLMQFDVEHEYIFESLPISNVGRYKLEPRGMTALLDAVGKVITETGKRLENMNEEDRPGLVVIAIITDGEENASHNFTKDQIKEMIEHQQSVYNWQFTFLGANQDAFSEAGEIGIKGKTVANFSTNNIGKAFLNVSHNVTRMRTMSFAGKSVESFYTDEEIKDMK